MMAKRVEISLKEIGRQIEQAEGKLSKAARRVKDSVQKKKVAAKIKALKRVKSELKLICKSYNIVVPQNGSGK